MRAFVFGGKDFGAWCRAKVLDERPLSLAPVSAAVPGRAGTSVLDVAVPPKVVRFKLFLEPLMKMDALRLAALKHEVAAALLSVFPCELSWQENYVYRDVLCTDVGTWSESAQCPTCEVEFTCFDPIAYSRVARVETVECFKVGGTWETYPVIELVADGSDEISVANVEAGSFVALTGGFDAGSVVVLDFEHETVRVDGLFAGGRIALNSTFSALRPGEQGFAFEGVSSVKIKFFERWV